MDVRGDQVLVSDAAVQLGVTPQRVRVLLANGDLRGQRVGGVWMIDPDSIAQYHHTRRQQAGRALAPVTAWAALLTSFATDVTDELASAFGIAGKRRARIRALRDRDIDDWRWLARRRATVNRFSTRSAYLARLRKETGCVPAGSSAAPIGALTDGRDTFDAYVDGTTARQLVGRYKLRPDAAGNVTLRTINLTDPEQLEAVRHAPIRGLVIAVDLCEDRDTRTAAIGRDMLSDLVHRTSETGP